MDVDGTLTNGNIYISASGETFKAFNVKDGLGIAKILPSLEIEPIIITGRKSSIVSFRCRELGIQRIHQGVGDKADCLEKILNDTSAEFDAVAYIGDDLNDLDCMLRVKHNGGVTGCPSDAAHEITAIADFISDCRGGEGAVRSFIEYIQQTSAISRSHACRTSPERSRRTP